MENNNFELNLFNKRTIYTNCIVEVLENTYTNQISVGWYATESTEEYEKGLEDA